MNYRTHLKELGARTEARVLALFDSYTAATITGPDFVAAAAATIAKANARAVAMADLSLAATLMLEMGEPVAALGLSPKPGDVDRLTKAAQTLLAAETDPRDRIARLGRVEPLDAAGEAYSDAISQRENVTGYRRGVSADGCELCQWLAKTHLDPAGYVYPAKQPMNRHKGCTCTQIPVRKGQKR